MKLSIITISYNSEKTIENTILSVINQKDENVEYIIIDGNSNDSTMSIIDKYRDRIDYVVSERDKGISDAFNKGINLSSGEYIGLINSDDFLAKGALNKIVKAIDQNPNGDVFYGNVVVFSDKYDSNYCYKPPRELSKLKLEMIISHPGTFVKKSCYDKYGLFDTGYKCAMDFELISKMYNQGANFVYVDEIISWFCLGGVSQKQAKTAMQEGIIIAQRNGIDNSTAKKYYTNIYRKTVILEYLRKAHVETLLRKLFNSQQSNIAGKDWYKECGLSSVPEVKKE